MTTIFSRTAISSVYYLPAYSIAMPASQASVPAYVEISPSEILHGIFALEGVLTYTDQTITFAYQTSDIRSIKSETMTFALPLDALQAIEWKEGLMHATLILRPKRLITLDQVPWASQDAIVLLIKRKHRAQAASLASSLQDVLATARADEESRIPFQLPSANLGFTEIKGLLYLDADYLVFEVGTGMPGGSHKNRQIIKIEPQALESIRLDPGLRQDQLSIRPKTRDLFRAMPGMYRRKEELVLTIARRNRDDAAYLVQRITSIIAQA